jgi:YHS domain-containing protein
MKKMYRIWHMLLVAVFAAPLLVHAASVELNVDANGVALHGYDPVAYFDQSAAVKGSPQHALEVNGATYHFINAESRDTFAEDPTSYLPQFGGYCAMGTAMGRKLDIDPESWRIVDGKLYLNVNADVQTRWLSDLPTHVTQAEAKWQEIRDVSPDQLN